MQIYHYDPVTGEFTGATGAADESPLEPGAYLIPAHATDKPVPTLESGEVAIFATSKWRVVADYRNRPVCALDEHGYYAGPGRLSLGESPDALRILADPPAADLPRPKWDGAAWVDGRTDTEILADYTAAIQARLDRFAGTRGYDGILSACSYASSTNAKFQAEGQYCVSARDETWAACYAIMAEIEAGVRAIPSLEELLAELPVLEWPSQVI